MPDATLTAAEGVGEAPLDPSVVGLPRALYLVENVGLQATTMLARALYLVENLGLQATSVLARALYLDENRQIQAVEITTRGLYLEETYRDGEVFPWLMAIDPTEQYRGGTVELFGDGFGEILEAAAGATKTSSTVSGGNIATNATDRAASDWLSTAGAASWIRFTFGAAKKVVAIALEQGATGAWGTPRFRFSDGLGDVDGAGDVPAYDAGRHTAEVPVGGNRVLYTLPTPRTTTYVEVAIAGSGSGGTRGFREVWIFEDLDQAAEGSSAILNNGLVSETALGIVSWLNRSPGLWPANSGDPILAAATVTIPADAESGLVVVEETV